MEEENESDDDEDVVFEKAKEFLSIVQSQPHDIGSKHSTQANEVKRSMPTVQFGVPKLKKLKTMKKDDAVITSSQRKKLERVKIPVTSFRRIDTQNECSEEKNESVQKMLEHIRRLPQQEIYSPPKLPMVVFDNQTHDQDTAVISQNSSHSPAIVESSEFQYLTSEQDLTTWELLKSSPTNCNVFVGNISYKIDKKVLLAAFQPFVVEQHQQNIKVRIVTNSLSGGSKGYGFVKFPYRRAAELAMICMQGFQIFDREMQLGWGQEEPTDILQAGKAKHTKKLGAVISDSQGRSGATSANTGSKPNRKRRWDVETDDSCKKITFPGQLQQAVDGLNSSKIRIMVKESSFKFPESRTLLKWLTKEQRVKMLKAVCENLRKNGVKHHLGVFGVYFEPDNSRLFVVCCKTLAEEQLMCEFSKYGAMEMNINKDPSGLSKGSVIVQYETSVSAESAMKELHGKVFGTKPLTVKLAQPKIITH